MKAMYKLLLLGLFCLCLALPVNAQEPSNTEEVTMLDENLALDESSEEGVVTGKVTALDIDAGLITIKTEAGLDQTFNVINGETILWRGIDDIELSSIKAGEDAEVGYYTDDTGKLIASWVDVLPAQQQEPGEAGVAPVTTAEPEATEEMAPVPEASQK